MKLNDLYKLLLSTANLVATNDGYISLKVGDVTKPTMIKGKRLVLPTKEQLANPNWDERIVFHPLSENAMRGESIILEEFRSSLNARLNHTIGLLSFNLLVIATSTADHVKLSPDQSEFLSSLKNADDKTLDVFQKLLKVMPVNQHQNSFVSIYLKRGGSVNGKRHSRVGVVNFPFYEELKKDGDVYGVKLRVKDRETLINLMEYIYPVIVNDESYNRGSDSDIAPYLDSLMKTVIAIAAPINDQLILFKNIIDDADEMLIEDGWVETFDNLGVMMNEIRMVPMQAGNEGSVKSNVTQPISVIQPTTNPLPTAVMGGYTKPVVNYPPVNSGYPPVNNFNQPPAPVNTGNGLDFDSILRSNPALGGLPFNVGMPVNNQPRASHSNPSFGMNNGGRSGYSNNNNSGYNNGGYNNNGYNNGNRGI